MKSSWWSLLKHHQREEMQTMLDGNEANLLVGIFVLKAFTRSCWPPDPFTSLRFAFNYRSPLSRHITQKYCYFISVYLAIKSINLKVSINNKIPTNHSSSNEYMQLLPKRTFQFLNNIPLKKIKTKKTFIHNELLICEAVIHKRLHFMFDLLQINLMQTKILLIVFFFIFD